MIYFTSDQHFGHANIIQLCKRPFANIEEMDAELIKRWNETVTPDDTVYMLGDFAFRNAKPIEYYVKQLNGHKHLIRGNHDHGSDTEYLSAGFESVQDLLTIGRDRKAQTIVMFHYPILSWLKKGHGSWHVFGHVHETPVPELAKHKAFNVGVDVNDFRPISYMALEAIMNTRDAASHHSKRKRTEGSTNK